MHISSLEELIDRGASSEKGDLRVCVVSSEILGPVAVGGIAAATAGLVENLAASGHHVTVLYTQVWYGQPLCRVATWPVWVRLFKERNVDLVPLVHSGNWNDWRGKARSVKAFLASRVFDLVYFNDHHGSGYYAMAARRAGLLAFNHQTQCVVAHGGIEWAYRYNGQRPSSRGDFELMALERRSVEWADAVISPSAYLLKEYANYEWRLPKHLFRQPLAWRADPLSDGVDLRERRAIDEIVFFGRLEARKGLWLFCEAIELLGNRLEDKSITFLGPRTETGGVSSETLLVDRKRTWPCEVRVLMDYGRDKAIAYLRKSGRLAIMPSVADNSPCTVYECLEHRIPFLTCRGSGAEELVHVIDHDEMLSEASAQALAKKLLACITQGAHPARPSFDFVDNWEVWARSHLRLASLHRQMARSCGRDEKRSRREHLLELRREFAKQPSSSDP